MKPSQIAWLVGMIGSVCTALLGQAELIGEPWRHYVTVVAIMCGTASAYMMQRPAPAWDGLTERRQPGHATAKLTIAIPADLKG